MAPTVRLIEPDEAAAFVRSVMIPFLEPLHDPKELEELAEQVRPGLEADRTWVVDDGGRLVGNAGIHTRALTLPGVPGRDCPEVPFAAVTDVGVHPTHRRKGLMRALMGTMLADARERGEPLAGLLASQSSIYGRFGFGWATTRATYVLEPGRADFLHPAPELSLQLVGGSEAADVVPAAFDAARRRWPAQLDRDKHTWDVILSDRTAWRGGRSALTFVVTDGGVAGYRAEDVVEQGRRFARVHVDGLVGATADIEAALWRFLLDLDLVDEVRVTNRPVDEPIRHRLTDPRRLRTDGVSDFLWLRVLDTPAALTARHWETEGRLVLDVRPPPTTPDALGRETGSDPAAGRWVLDAGPAGCRVTPAGGESADLVLGVDDLGSLLAGGVSARTLMGAGRVDEERAGAAGDADRLFATWRSPLCSTGF